MYKPNYILMTAGPTQVRQNVMKARSEFFGNSDLDNDFFVYYAELAEKIQRILNAKKSKVLIMSGEAMLGLDAVCASLVEKDDKVLVISNGIFGKGFKDMMEVYGAQVTLYEDTEKKEIDLAKLEEFLKENHDFKCATVVHCDTPTGVLNDVEAIAKLLNKYNIISIVDTVAASFGTALNIDESGIDIAICGSQKALSVPTGLTIMTVSDRVFKTMNERKTKIHSYYCNLLLWENALENRYFPYTMPSSDMLGLGAALDNILAEGIENVFKRHKENFDYARKKIEELGLELFLESGFSPTALAFLAPKNLSSEEFRNLILKEHNIFLSGSYLHLAEKVVRIGTMGENSTRENIDKTLKAIEDVMKKI